MMSGETMVVMNGGTLVEAELWVKLFHQGYQCKLIDFSFLLAARTGGVSANTYLAIELLKWQVLHRVYSSGTFPILVSAGLMNI